MTNTPKPYCLTTFDHDRMRSRISGQARYATVADADAVIARSSKPFGFYMVDIADRVPA